MENVKITQLVATDTVTGTAGTIPKAAFSNLTLWSGSTLLGTANTPIQVAASSGTGTASYTYTFNISGSPVIVPQAGSISVAIKGDAASYSSQGATDNASNILSVSSASMTALGHDLEQGLERNGYRDGQWSDDYPQHGYGDGFVPLSDRWQSPAPADWFDHDRG